MKALILALAVLATVVVLAVVVAVEVQHPGWIMRYQTGLGAGFGLLGLGGVAFFNAVLMRRRDDRMRDAEKRNLSIALRAEVLAIKLSLESNHKFFGQALDQRMPLHSAFLHFFVIHDQPVFDAATSKLGLLGGDLTKNVVHFYAAITAANHKFELIVEMAVPRPLDPADEEDKEMLKGMGEAVEDARLLAAELEAFAAKQTLSS